MGTRDDTSDVSQYPSYRSTHHCITSLSESSGTTDIDDDVVSQHSDSSKPIPRVLSFSWSSLVIDAISIMSTIPFIVLACLLAQANGKPVHETSKQNFGNGIRVVSLTCLETLS